RLRGSRRHSLRPLAQRIGGGVIGSGELSSQRTRVTVHGYSFSPANAAGQRLRRAIAATRAEAGPVPRRGRARVLTANREPRYKGFTAHENGVAASARRHSGLRRRLRWQSRWSADLAHTESHFPAAWHRQPAG